MKIQIKAEPKFWLGVKLDTILALKRCAELQYDAACRAAAMKGGFIYGWENIIVNDLEMVSATWRELDMSLKICEMGVHATAEERELINTYSNSVRAAMTKARELTSFEVTLP